MHPLYNQTIFLLVTLTNVWYFFKSVEKVFKWNYGFSFVRRVHMQRKFLESKNHFPFGNMSIVGKKQYIINI